MFLPVLILSLLTFLVAADSAE